MEGALSVSHSLASSPKGGASGETGNFAWIAKASRFGGGGCDQREQTERARLFASTTYLFLL